jgi:hypothetical protein
MHGFFVLLSVIGPFASAQLPGFCPDTASHPPADRAYDIPGVGAGTLIVASPTAALVARAKLGQLPFVGHAHLIDRLSHQVMTTLDFPDEDFAHAGYDDSSLYLWTDGIGYYFDTSTARPLHSIVRTDY